MGYSAHRAATSGKRQEMGLFTASHPITKLLKINTIYTNTLLYLNHYFTSRVISSPLSNSNPFHTAIFHLSVLFQMRKRSFEEISHRISPTFLNSFKVILTRITWFCAFGPSKPKLCKRSSKWLGNWEWSPLSIWWTNFARETAGPTPRCL